MKTPALLFVLLATRIGAITIPIDLGKEGLASDRIINFNELNTLPLDGSFIQINLSFGSKFVRLFPSTSSGFAAVIVFGTTASGFLADCSGLAFMTDANGAKALNSTTFGGGSTSGGENLQLAGGYVFPLLSEIDGNPVKLSTNVDLFGATFNLTLPTNPGAIITSATLLLNVGESLPAHWFAIGPNAPESAPVPDTGSTLFLFGIALLCLNYRKFTTVYGTGRQSNRWTSVRTMAECPQYMRRELKPEEHEEIVSAVAAGDRIKATDIYLRRRKAV